MRRVPAMLASCCISLFAGCDDDPIRVQPGDTDLELIASGLTSPVSLSEPPDGTGRLFVADQAGLVRIITADGALLDEPFLDLRSRMVALRPGYDERGLLGLAFHPSFATNGRFYVYYSAALQPGAPADFDHTSHVSEFRASAGDPSRADAGSERIVLRVDQPQSNHNAGTVAFGPDGMLYISLGDGGGADDVGVGHVDDWYEVNGGGNGQDITQNLLGSILRVDVDGGDPYGIPADNPFVGSEGLDEIWAFGFRNPYRFSFDPGGSNALLVGDAGQDLWEEVSIVGRGGNYGWNVREATYCFSTADPETSLPSCPDVDPNGNELIDPVIEFRNAKNDPGGIGLVVVAGHVYRGRTVPALNGMYVFGAWSTSFQEPDGTVLVAQPTTGPGLWTFEPLDLESFPDGRVNRYVLGLGQDLDGEIYVLTSTSSGPAGTTGEVFRITS